MSETVGSSGARPSSEVSTHRINPKLAATSLALALAFVVIKFGVHAACGEWPVQCLEVFELGEIAGRLFPSILAGAIFVVGLVLAGTLSDYKESERFPAEVVSALESLYHDTREVVTRKKNHWYEKEPKEPSAFPLDSFKSATVGLIRSLVAQLNSDLLTGNPKGGSGDEEIMRWEGRPERRKAPEEHLSALFDLIIQLEARGLPANHSARLKNEHATVRKLILRAHHIQKTRFVPSASILLYSTVGLVVTLLLILKPGEGELNELAIIGGITCYLFAYMWQLLRTLERPFRPTDRHNRDDVSFLLFRDFIGRLGEFDPATYGTRIGSGLRSGSSFDSSP